MEEKIIDLEIRATHAEASLEELTRTVLEQQKQIEELRNQLEQVKEVVRQVSPVADISEETPPPHY